MYTLGEKIALSGMWDFSVMGSAYEKRKVPRSYFCCGTSLYHKSFTYQKKPGTRVLLCFEGITYQGILDFNGHDFDKMEPYSEYVYDVTDIISRDNEIKLTVLDLNADFGPSNGWANYSGIIRDVYLYIVPETYISDVFFHSDINTEDCKAVCTAEIELNGNNIKSISDCTVELTLNDTSVSETKVAVSDGKAVAVWNVDNISLWSNEKPVLYELKVRAGSSYFIQKVGFKKFEARGNKFYLNGKPIFLAGVCRHDIWDEKSGHTLTDEQIEQDMQMIKSSGINFVRLVHYPHDRRVIEAADRLGLLVSCEPGFWWMELENEELLRHGFEVMKRVVLRDRNNVSVAFWLTFNECVLNLDFIKRIVGLVKQYDPTRMVSGANCMDKVSTKQLFDEGGYDFYTYHPYGYAAEMVTGGVSEGRIWKTGWQTMQGLCEYLNTKPLLFTEWGGNYVHDNPNLFSLFCKEIFRLGNNEAPDPVLAGASYWVWADYKEYNRIKPSNISGTTVEGLTDENRRPRTNLNILSTEIVQQKYRPYEPDYDMTFYGCGSKNTNYAIEDIYRDYDEELQTRLWNEQIENFKNYKIHYADKIRVIDYGPQIPDNIPYLGSLQVDLKKGKPVLTNTTGRALTISVNKKCRELYVIGNVCFEYIFPLGGIPGETAARYILEYADGSKQEIPLRNGFELQTVHGIYSSSRIDAHATALNTVLTVTYDKSWEIYNIPVFVIPCDSQRVLKTVTLEVTKENYTVLTYGITAGRGE